MLGRIVAGGRVGRGEDILHRRLAGAAGGHGQKAADDSSQIFQDAAAGDILAHGTSLGWWGTWHSVQTCPCNVC
jgi:hypothetical protein